MGEGRCEGARIMQGWYASMENDAGQLIRQARPDRWRKKHYCLSSLLGSHFVGEFFNGDPEVQRNLLVVQEQINLYTAE